MIIQNSMEEQMKKTVNILAAILIMLVLAAAPFESNQSNGNC